MMIPCRGIYIRIPILLLLFLLFWIDSFIDAKGDDNPVTRNFKCRKNGCCDHHEWCRFWASAGECSQNKKWMSNNCQLACNSCSKKIAPSISPPRQSTKETAAKKLIEKETSKGLNIAKHVTKPTPSAFPRTTAQPKPIFKSTISRHALTSATTLIPSSFSRRGLRTRKPHGLASAAATRFPSNTKPPTILSSRRPLSRNAKKSLPSLIKSRSLLNKAALSRLLRVTRLPRRFGIIPRANPLPPPALLFFPTTHMPLTTTFGIATSLPSTTVTSSTPKTTLPISTTKTANILKTTPEPLKLFSQTATTLKTTSRLRPTFMASSTTTTTTRPPMATIPSTTTSRHTTTIILTTTLKSAITLTTPLITTTEKPHSTSTSTISLRTTTFTFPPSSTTTLTIKLTSANLDKSSTKSGPVSFLTSISPRVKTTKATILLRNSVTSLPISPKVTQNVVTSTEQIFTTLKKSRFDPPENSVLAKKNAQCRSLLSNPSDIALNMQRRKLIFTAEDNNGRLLVSLDDVIRSNLANACTPRLDDTNCERNQCYNMYFRTMDGSCNNLEKPLQGASYRPYNRLLPPEYDDGLGAPISSIKHFLPSPREVNKQLLSSDKVVLADDFNSLLMQYGQFISHDMAKTTLVPSTKCPNCESIPGRCLVIKLSRNETNSKFVKEGCIKMSRSSPICGSGKTKPRQQLNENTGYIDASPIYGSSVGDLTKFRFQKSPFLKLTNFKGNKILPFDTTKCKDEKSCSVIFLAGDSRVNLFIGLSSLHVIYVREHNRLARALRKINPKWSDERVFQESRKIVGAQHQAIIYREYLPKILGSSFLSSIGPYKGYNANIDATIVNEFTAAAFRFGHGMIQEEFPRLDENFKNTTFGEYKFVAGTLNSQLMVNQGGIDPIIRGLLRTPLKRPQRLTPSITENMFGSTDLGTININRGRDHGIPSYDKYRDLCGMSKARNFVDLGKEILSPFAREKLERLYGSVDKIDLYAGALTEDPILRGLIGPTMACIIGPQFKRSRDGDRFYYENPGVFTPAQLREIRKSSLSRILCDNGDRINLVPKEAFRTTNLTPCSQIPQMDLSKWKEL